MTRKTKQNKNLPHLEAELPVYEVKGITGTSLSAGYVTGKEHNPKLTTKNWVKEAEEMLASDPIIKRSWNLVKQTLLSAKWIFKPGVEGDPVAEELARFANEAFGFDGHPGMMNLSFEEQLNYILDFIPVGYRYTEEIYYIAPDSIGREKVWLGCYADREPSAHLKWLSRDNQNLDGVMQNMVGLVEPEPIPANKILLLTLNKTGSNFEGVGLLRPCWWWWKEKQRTANLMSVGVERWAIPTPIVQVDRSVIESNGYSTEEVNQMIQEAELQAANYISQKQGYLVENSVVKFDVFGSGEFNPAGALQVISECDNQISQAFMAQFMNLGISDTGSRAVGEIHLSVFRRACINFLDLVASAISGQDRRGAGTIGRLINFNYGKIEPTKLPRLTHSGLDNDQLVDSLNSLPALVQSQLLTPDDNLERAIRQRIGAGNLPLEAQRTSQDRSVANNPNTALNERLKQIK